MLAFAKLAVQPRAAGELKGGGGGMGGLGLIKNEELRREVIRNAWPAFASLSWAMVMYVFRWHPETVQPSLRSSMSYMWVSLFPSFLCIEKEGVWLSLDGEMLTRGQIRTIRQLGLAPEFHMAQQVASSMICGNKE
jgi:hypothetical protein